MSESADDRPAPQARPPLVPGDALLAMDDEQLLDLQIRQLDIHIEGSALEPRIAQLHEELAACGLTFRPHYWLSDEWFTPDGIAGIAIPFYLAHPRLSRLELTQMLEIEGGDPEWCMRILRHEAGHAFDNAFDLRRRPQRRAVFGNPGKEYPEFYAPKPYSKSYVLHLDMWYAQAHPDEDFAETFAVWLTPNSQWEKRYRGWGAFKKLEYMDSLMKSLAGHAPGETAAHDLDPLQKIRKTLRQVLSAEAPALRCGPARSSTIATCGGCSRMRPSSPTTWPPRSSSRATGSRCAASCRTGPGSTNTR